MIRRVRFALAAAVFVSAGACNSSTPVSTTNQTLTSPSLAAAVDHFTGTLTKNGAITFPFTVSGSGAVSAVVDSVSPDSTIVFGMSLGTWNGSFCQAILTNDAQIQGQAIQGSVSTSGTLCLRVYDVGNLVQPETFVVEVGHP
jgi:hypothetical protein